MVTYLREKVILSKKIIARATPGERRKGKPRRRWVKDIEDWMGL